MRLLALLLLCAACHDPLALEPPAGAEPFAPPAVYAGYWAEIEACSGVHSDFSRTRWSIYQDRDYIAYPHHSRGNHSYLAVWHEHTILLTRLSVTEPTHVRAAILSYLLRGTWPIPQYYRTTCAIT